MHHCLALIPLSMEKALTELSALDHELSAPLVALAIMLSGTVLHLLAEHTEDEGG